MICNNSFTVALDPVLWLIDPLLTPPTMLSSLLNQLKNLRSSYWWLRKLHPWSVFALIGWRWLCERDRRTEHQVRLQKKLLHLNFRDIQEFLTDFIRPEFWLM
jgi:hypothetical protein